VLTILYQLKARGEETLSSTSVFNFCHCAIASGLINSFIYVMRTLPLPGGT